MSQHTPTPWTATFPITAVGKRDAWVISGGRRSIALMPDTADMQNDEANAAFIVRACNSHDALVEALEDLLTETWTPKEVLAARAALALAKEKP